MTINSKREFYRLWKAGRLGNKPQTFTTIEEAVASTCSHIGFREVGVPGGRFDLVRREEATNIAADWTKKGQVYSLDGSVGPQSVVFQGELLRSHKGLEGFFAIEPRMTMRASLNARLHKHMDGARLACLLRHYLDASSYDDVMILLETYPDSVIELSVFDHWVGEIPRRNTIIWEVRNY